MHSQWAAPRKWCSTSCGICRPRATSRSCARSTKRVRSAASVKDFYVRQIGADPARVEVVYNAVDFGMLKTTAPRDEIRARLHVPAQAMAAGVIARLTDQKGHSVLFDALASEPDLAA